MNIDCKQDLWEYLASSTKRIVMYGMGNGADKILCACAEKGVEAALFQSNHEGDLVDEIQKAYGVMDGIVINPGAYTHTSIAILDAVKSVSIPTVEVHISKVEEREDFRQISYVRLACVKTITGHGTDGYLEAIDYLIEEKQK